VQLIDKSVSASWGNTPTSGDLTLDHRRIGDQP